MRRVTAVLCAATAAFACAPGRDVRRLPCGVPASVFGASEKQLLLLRPSARCDLGACYEELRCNDDTALDKVAYTVRPRLFFWDRVTAVSLGHVWKQPFSPNDVAAEISRTTRHLVSLWGPPERAGLLKNGQDVILIWGGTAKVTTVTFSTQLSIERVQYEVRVEPRASLKLDGMVTGTAEDAARAAGSMAVW